MLIYTYTCSCRIHTDAMINRHRKTSLTKYLPLTLLQGLENGYSRFACESVLETEHNWNILTPNLWSSRCVFLVLLILNRSPGVHSAGCWLSLLHLISIFSEPQFIRAPSPFGLAWLSLPHLGSTGTRTPLARWTQLSYILVRRLLDLWNRMFDRHQAEITVMQFTGHSLPVHQSMSVPWEFFSSSHFISQFPPTRFPLLTAIGMCHFLPVHHLEWSFGPGQKSKYYISTIFWVFGMI